MDSQSSWMGCQRLRGHSLPSGSTARCHTHEIGVCVAATCEGATLRRAAGIVGNVLYDLSRRPYSAPAMARMAAVAAPDQPWRITQRSSRERVGQFTPLTSWTAMNALKDLLDALQPDFHGLCRDEA